MIKHIRFVPTLSPPRFRLARRYHPSVPVCTQQVPTPPEKRNRKPRCPACVRERAREVTVLRVSVGVCSNSQDPARSAPTSPPPIPFQSGRVTGLGQVKEASFLVSPPRRSAANQDLSVSPQHRSAANVSKRRSAERTSTVKETAGGPGLPQPPRAEQRLPAGRSVVQ